MSDEEFEVILAELRQIRKAITEAVNEIVHQEGEIQALHWLLQHKGITTVEELDDARKEGTRLVGQFLLQAESGSLNKSPRALSGQARSKLCHRGEHRHRVIP